MSCSAVVNSIGLAFDIIGAMLMWKYGLPEQISRDGAVNIVVENVDNTEKEKAHRYDCNAGYGIFLLVIGFVLQLVSNYL